MERTKVVRLSVAAALASAVSLAMVVEAEDAAAGKVKCYGIAKAGENHCADIAGTHGCAAQSTVDYDGGEWQAAESVEACEDAGGSLEPFEGVNTRNSTG